MKTKILFIVILCLPISIWAQKGASPYTLSKIEVTPPEFTNIKNVAMLFNNNNPALIENYLKEHTVYPEEAAKCYKQGTAVVQFIVTSEGEVTDFKVINSVCPMIDEEIIRVLSTTNGMWKPGIRDQKPADMEQEVSMMFVASRANRNSPVEYFTRQAKNLWVRGNTLFLEKHNPKKALKFYNESVKYLPYDPSTLLLRGFCKYELGDREGARSDWERVNTIGKYDADEFIQNLAYLPGYDEMKIVLNE